MKLLHKIGKWFIIAGLGLWFFETTIFQILYGWHYAPINKTELYFDRAASWLITIGLFLLIWAFVKVVRILIDRIY